MDSGLWLAAGMVAVCTLIYPLASASEWIEKQIKALLIRMQYRKHSQFCDCGNCVGEQGCPDCWR